MVSLLRSLCLLSLLVSPVTSFSGVDISVVQHSISSVLHDPHVVATTSPAIHTAQHALGEYKHALAFHPLPTKMMTGAILATAGDAIAQSKEQDQPYDVRRAASFGTFDMAYRALQHASFPWIVEHCRGQFLSGALAGLFASTSLTITPELTNNFAAMEQTLASQLGIVPFLYYPVFFALTGFIQGLTVEGAVERAQEKFLPLMQRNLLFWIPVQFIQFGFVQEDLQIPFLSVCGLAWTFILSIMAGSTKTYQTPTNDNVVAAMEDDIVVYSDQELDEIGAAVMEATTSAAQQSTADQQQQNGYVYEQR